MQLKIIYKVLTIISAASVLIPICFSIWRIKTLNKSLRVLFFYLLLCLISDALSFTVMDYKSSINTIFNIFTFIECACVCFIYFLEYRKVITKLFVILLFFLFMGYSIKNFILEGRISENDSKVNAFEAGVIILISGMYFIKVLFDESISQPEKHYFYWINLAFTVYFGSAFLLFLTNDFIEHCSHKTTRLLWSIYLIINILSNILISTGICKMKATQR